MIRQYETTFIVDAHLSTEEIEKVITKYSQQIEQHKGKIKLIDRWGKRRLAYEIAKKQYGYYVYIRYEAEGTVVDALEKDFKLDETILRYLVLRVPTIVIKDEIRKASIPKEEPEAKEVKKDTPVAKVPEKAADADEKEVVETPPEAVTEEPETTTEETAEETDSESEAQPDEEEKPVSSEE